MSYFVCEKEKIYPSYVLKHHPNCENQLIFLLIPNREKRKAKSKEWCHHLALKKASALLRGITSKKNGDFYCFNCLHPFRTKNKLESHKNVSENKYFCNVIIPSEDTKISEFNKYQKSDKAPFIIQAVFECMIGKIDGCKNNPENSSTPKVSKHIPSGFPISTISSFRSMENRFDVYRSKDCVKNFKETWGEHAMKIIIFKKKNMKLLAKEQQESYEYEKICYSCKDKFKNKYLKDKRHCKVTYHVIDNNSLLCVLMYHAIRSSLSKLSRILVVTKQLVKNVNNFWLWSRA